MTRKMIWIFLGLPLAGIALAAGIQTTNMWLTPLGGVAVKLTNNTGATTIAGEILAADSTASNKFILAPANTTAIIGVAYASGYTQAGAGWVAMSGIANVCLADLTACTLGSWLAISSTTTGRAVSSATIPAAGQEIGKALSATTGGTNTTVKAFLHFN